MADRDRERIRLVRRPRLGIEPEDEPHHPLHLALLSSAVTADRLLDASRSVLGTIDPDGRGGDENGAARLTDGERDTGVCTHVGLLERDGVRPVLGDELLDAGKDLEQPCVRASPSGRPPVAGNHHPEAPAASVDDPVPARSRPWIDAEDLHVKKVCRPSDVPPSGRCRVDDQPPGQFVSAQADRRSDAA